MNNKPNINANEIKQWDFCPRQWYLLKTKGRKTGNQTAEFGRKFHARHARPVKRIQRTQSFIIKVLMIGGLIWAYWLLSHLWWQ